MSELCVGEAFSIRQLRKRVRNKAFGLGCAEKSVPVLIILAPDAINEFVDDNGDLFLCLGHTLCHVVSANCFPLGIYSA